ncbi:hypothetical protein GQ457_01G008010 [Hibiscus cannabinus]
MSVSFKYWDDCVDPEDLEAMWNHPDVRTEWEHAGETKGLRVHLSRDPDGQPYLTQIEMRVAYLNGISFCFCGNNFCLLLFQAVAEIVTSRQFDSQIDPEMICAIAELESDRHPLARRYDKKNKLLTIGLMQVATKVAEWTVRSRSEEFVVRAYRGGGARKGNHKSTLPYWKGYLQVKECFQSRKHFDGPSPMEAPISPASPASPTKGDDLYWDTRVSAEDMEQMWNHPDVCKEWTKSKEIRGNVRFSCDRVKRPYLSRVELRAVLCALADIVSMRFIDGDESSTGLMGIDYSTAFWLYTITEPVASLVMAKQGKESAIHLSGFYLWTEKRTSRRDVSEVA